MQDTERNISYTWRAICRSFNPFDPMQDTESLEEQLEELRDLVFQPIRSDAGY